MATLQKLRNKGSLLIAFVGIALFAFIAGDIVKLFQKAPEEAVVGTVNGEGITVSDFYEFRNQCEQAYKLLNGATSLDESNQEEITQMAWNTLTNYKSLVAQAAEAGLTVTPEELSYILSTNWGGIAQQYTSRLPQVFATQTGAFNVEFINSINSEYNTYKESGAMPEELALLHDAWKFIETSLVSDVISRKLMNVYAFCSTTPNQAVAQSNFDLNNNTYSVEIAAYPYNSFDESQVAVSDQEIEEFYNANKENYFKVPFNLYDIYYINQEIKPTSKDINAVRAELDRYAASLKEENADVEDIALYSSSECPYDGFLWTIDAITIDSENQTYVNKFKENHKFHVQQNNVGEVAAPFEDRNDNTISLVMNVRKAMVPDTIKLRAIAIQSESAEELNATADSLLNALNNKADFNKLAENYSADTVEFKTKNFITTIGFIPTPEAQNKVYTAKVDAYDVIEFGENAKLIFQVMETKGSVEAYDALIIERKIPVSAETYNQEYNKLSQLVTSCKNIEDLQKNVLSTSYRLEQQRSLNPNSMNIANKPGTRELLKWVLGGRNVGDISNIHEYISGNKKYFIVAAVSEITPEGYVALDKVKENIKFQLTNEKKGDLIAAELNGKNIDELRANENIKFSTTDQVEYKKATSVQSINADELVISAAVANMEAGEVSAPIKGDNAVYVVKVLSKEAKNAEFNAQAEADYIQSLDFYGNPNVIGQLIQDAIGKTYKVENKVYEHM